LSKYNDGGIFAIETTRTVVPLKSVTREYFDQNFHMMLLNRGSNLITVYWTPLLGNEVTVELPASSPGVVLDGLSYEAFVNGIEAIAATGTTNLGVTLYSNDISFSETRRDRDKESYPRDTLNYPA
jgi:hypothetical protein